MTETSRTSSSNAPQHRAAGKGMPARNPQPQQPQTDKAADLHDVSVESTLELPRDRDESLDMTRAQPSPEIEQAAKDIEKGLKDTSKAPEMDKAYKKL